MNQDTKLWRVALMAWMTAAVLACALAHPPVVDPADPLIMTTLPNDPSSVRFAVIGDFGDGGPRQQQVADQMMRSRKTFQFNQVITVGDNLYTGSSMSDFVSDFEVPYKALLDAGVLFYATLGNHDATTETAYMPWHMENRTFYLLPIQNVDFFMLNSEAMDASQLAWVDAVLRPGTTRWKIAVFHRPLYSDGLTHGPALDLRPLLEPRFKKAQVDFVLSGHDHIYERIVPQSSVRYFISGAASDELRIGDTLPSSLTAAYYDADQSFMLWEILGDVAYFNCVTRTGQIVDSGSFRRRGTE